MLLVSATQVTAQQDVVITTAWTTPVFMGGSINVTVTVRNLSPTYVKVGKVEVLFDWNDTYSVQGPMILQPGQEYGWNFPRCQVPSDTCRGPLVQDGHPDFLGATIGELEQ